MVTNLSSAMNFSFSYPDVIQKNQEFNITIHLDSNDSYDVKSYVHNATKEYSEIFSEGKWKSPHFYLISVFPKIKEFTLRSYYLGETEICVQMRKSGSKNFDKVCNPIKVEEDNSQNNSQNNDSNNRQEDNKTSQEDKTPNNSEKKGKTKSLENQDSQKKKDVANLSSKLNKKIILNSPKSKSSEVSQNIFTSKKSDFRLWIVYSFTALCVLIIVILSFREL